jgi:hypothetical protein
MKDHIIDGVLNHHNEGTGEFTPYTPEEFTRIIHDLEEDREKVKSILETCRADLEELSLYIEIQNTKQP